MTELHLTVAIEGEDASALVERVAVEETDLRADLATLTFRDSTGVLPDVLHEGLTVEIDLGERTRHAQVFSGVITGIRAHFPERGPVLVVVEAADSLVKLGLQPRTKRWWNTTLSGIVRDLALLNGLRPGRIAPQADPVFSETRPVRQVEETDLALLHRLAAEHDCKVYVEHGGPANSLCFVATKTLSAKTDGDPRLELGGNLIDLSVEFDAFAADARERLVTTDPRTGDRTEVTEKLVTPTETAWQPDPDRLAALGDGAVWVGKMLAKGLAKKADLPSQWRTPERRTGAASGTLPPHGDRARRLGQTARGSVTGTIALRPRGRVVLAGCGGRWSGDWYLATVRHELDLGHHTYTTSFVAKR